MIKRQDQMDLLYDLLSAFTLLKNLPEAATFITDLLTRQEVRFLSKRLGIAKLLLSDFRYGEIAKILRVSHSTIAKVAAWLSEKGEGFRKVIKLIPEKRKRKNPYERSEWEKFKRSHAASFWPELLLEELKNNSIKRENEGLDRVFSSLESKRSLSRKIDEAYGEKNRKRVG